MTSLDVTFALQRLCLHNQVVEKNILRLPLLVLGWFFEQGSRLLMPPEAQAHHAVVDGIHMGNFFAEVQALLDRAEKTLG